MSPSSNKINTENGFPFFESVYPEIFHSNPTPQSLSNKLDGKLIDVNAAWEVLTAYKKEDVLGQSIEELNFISFEDSNAMHEVLTQNEKLKYHEVDIKRKDGVVTYGLATFQFVEFEEAAFVIGTIIDVSDIKIFQKKIFAANNFTECLLDSMFEALLILDVDLTCIKVNKAFCELTGFKENEILGAKVPFPQWSSENNDTISSYIEQCLNGVVIRDQLTLKKPNGDWFQIAITTAKITDYKGEIIGYVFTGLDITDLLKTQKELNNTSKRSAQNKDAILKLAGLVGDDLDYILQEITALAAKTMQVERVSIWSFNDEKTDLRLESSYNSKDQTCEKVMQFKIEDYSNYFKDLFKNNIIRADNTLDNESTNDFVKNYFKPLGITSALDVLIQGYNGYYGVLCFEHRGASRQWTLEEEEFVTSISNVISLAIERNERYLAEIQLFKSNEKLKSLNAELIKLKKDLEQENTYLREEIDLVFNYEEMVYGSAAFSQVLTEVEQVASTNATVLLLGESGTGKELLARAIHNISNRKNKPLIKVNCAAIPRELIESELFGHKKGSFTGAINDKLGKFQLADGGTLFLDEIGELPMDMQPKLLRAIQESEVEQIGSVKTQKVDIRIITATNRDLKQEIKNKNFREDLYFRINVFPITIPPLRERIEDIPILLEHFVNKYSKLYHKNVKYISEETKRNLQSYSWPGNIRELENLIERAIILSHNEKLIIPDFKSSEKESLISSTSLSLDDVQRIHIKKILKTTNWKIEGSEGAAELLEIKPSTLRDRMIKLGIKKPK
ncbi:MULTISPECIES: sigma 54-interacting transcriptional regulator [Bizionia]|uniref:PAS domain S-box protein n=1 Tax=Bizionia algoritergicola TaxID=291187 RepID=A0A5D0R193_9FLAO|nr:MULTISPECIES: sigma 54-interacting transcriptional regulator [Bizionia]OBX23095.1 Fis family transcriptional regulator [Bizionia sp. APA-3]TYB74755.1 PAS domain S-box protein [Bizionia algoritergicola]